MNDSALKRFFGVVARPQTWLGILYNWLAFPLGLFYFVFLITGLSLGIGLVVIWIGIPILLVVAGAWWLFGAFERLQAHYLLGADVPPAPREWERVDGVWAKLKAHFGSAATWKDLVYLLAKLPFGIVSTTLLVVSVSMTGAFLMWPFLTIFRVPVNTGMGGAGVPPWWVAIVSMPLGILVFFVSLHVLNAWSWVCARWAEALFSGPAVQAPAAPAPLVAPQAPIAVPPQAPIAVAPQTTAPAAPAPPDATPAMTQPPPTAGDAATDDETTS